LSGVPELGIREMKKTWSSWIGKKRDGKDLEFLKWEKERWKRLGVPEVGKREMETHT
jgi:hypothetical protein